MSFDQTDRSEKPNTEDRATAVTGGQYWTSADMKGLSNGSEKTDVGALGFPNLVIDAGGTGSASDGIKPPPPPAKKPPVRECAIDPEQGLICTKWHDQ